MRRSTGYSAFEVIYGWECLLPVQLAIDSWSTIDWDGIKDREELIMARMKQLDERQITETQAAENLRRSRIQNKAYFDSTRRLHPRELQDGDLVLAFKVRIESKRAHKLDDRWHGPYRIRRKVEDSTFYLLEELDGTPMKRKFAGNQLKKYFARPGMVNSGHTDGDGSSNTDGGNGSGDDDPNYEPI